ncbi:MAG: DUF4931 domain-containing protein [Candidatus Kerfeldbacteria bacterium]|nr:DUF4931 domain-containing protein [Candidatus Kerfeldbacteria bacterium]
MTTSEIRQDYIHDRVVIIAAGRKRRPHDFPPTTVVHQDQGPATCIFCPPQLRDVKALLTIGRGLHWTVKVIKNVYPVVHASNPKAYGYQEVVIDTPEHNVEFADLSVEHIAIIIDVFGKRIRTLERDSKIKYIMTFKNRGGKAGASIAHAHSQIFASSFVPPHIVDKRRRAEEYQIQKGRCYYEDLLVREQKGPRWITEDGHFGVIAPYASSYNYEAWIIPWRHVDNLGNLKAVERQSLAAMLKHLLTKLSTLGLPYNLFCHQLVNDKNEHFYLRIAPRGDVWAGLELGSRLIVNTVPPEDAARFYRGEGKKRPSKKRR